MRALLVLLLLCAAAFAGTTDTSKTFEESTEGAGLEILSSWQLLSVMALVISVILVAIAYMIGIGFEMPGMRAWAGTELVQIIANAILILVLLGCIIFVDTIISVIVEDSGLNIPECTDPTQSCLKAVTLDYLRDYVESSKEGALSILKNNMDAMGWANRRYGIYCTPAILPFPCLQAGFSTTVVAHNIMDTDMYAILFEYYTNLLASMEAQKFFVTEISFGMGPLILAAGIVGRSFFFTRKLGGLLIAIAIGIMFFFPAMYIFDWITLDMALAGDKAIEDQARSCPSECALLPPLAWIEGTDLVLVEMQDVYAEFSTADAATAAAIIDGSLASATNSYGSVVKSCYYGNYGKCPSVCRELPYPTAVPDCMNSSSNAEFYCNALPEQCKVVRLVEEEAEMDPSEYVLPPPVDPEDEPFYCTTKCEFLCMGISNVSGKCLDYCTAGGPAPCTPTPPPVTEKKPDLCPASCKVIPPLKSDCRSGDCIGSRADCRVWQYKGTDLTWYPQPPKDVGNYGACIDAKDCPVSLNANESCAYVIPATGLCDGLCTGCPDHCRVDGADTTKMDSDCLSGGALSSACSQCPESCKINKTQITAKDPPSGVCTGCPPERRLIGSSLPTNYTNGSCSVENCPKDYRVAIPRSACEGCLFTEESDIYEPKVQTKCSDVCAPPKNVPAKKAGEYTKIGGEGLVGRVEIQNVAKLIIPAYLLPLFNIVATLVFIKELSTILGGDIEIPGISKVF